MANPFATVFDAAYEFPIKRISGTTSGAYNSTTNVWTGPTVVTTTITGHFASFGTSERSRFETEWAPSSAGPIETGDRRFYTGATLAKGDIVEAWLDATGTQKDTYRVLGLVRRQDLMRSILGADRRLEWHLREAPQ